MKVLDTLIAKYEAEPETWTRGSSSYTGKFCIIGGLGRYSEKVQDLYFAQGLIEDALRKRKYAGTVPCWNDYVAENVQDVVKLLKEANV